MCSFFQALVSEDWVKGMDAKLVKQMLDIFIKDGVKLNFSSSFFPDHLYWFRN